jgi:hypothetical protein
MITRIFIIVAILNFVPRGASCAVDNGVAEHNVDMSSSLLQLRFTQLVDSTNETELSVISSQLPDRQCVTKHVRQWQIVYVCLCICM